MAMSDKVAYAWIQGIIRVIAVAIVILLVYVWTDTQETLRDNQQRELEVLSKRVAALEAVNTKQQIFIDSLRNFYAPYDFQTGHFRPSYLDTYVPVDGTGTTK